MVKFYQWEGEVLVLRVRVHPRASRNAVAGIVGDSVKIYLTAPPVEGKANAQLMSLLAEVFAVPKRQVSLQSGAKGRDKQVRIHAPRQIPAFIPLAEK